jgi:hypothetical protein
MENLAKAGFTDGSGNLRVIWADHWRSWDTSARVHCVRCGDGCSSRRHRSSSGGRPGIRHSHLILRLQLYALAPVSHKTSAGVTEKGLWCTVTWHRAGWMILNVCTANQFEADVTHIINRQRRHRVGLQRIELLQVSGQYSSLELFLPMKLRI